MAGFDDISELVTAYYVGMYTGDADLLRRVFDPLSRIRGFWAERFLDSDLESFVGAVTGGPSPMSLGQPQQVEVVDTWVEAGIATVIVRDTLHGAEFVDHLALVHAADGWRVVHKSYATTSQLPARS